MKVGEKVIVEKVNAGLYKITRADPTKPRFIGAAASAIITLTHLVFDEEASGHDCLGNETDGQAPAVKS